MRKVMLLFLIILALSIKIPDVNVTGINITGLFIGLASTFLSIAKMVIKEILLFIANML